LHDEGIVTVAEEFTIQSARRLYKAFQPEPEGDSDSRQIFQREDSSTET
jgi:hypothetical protein